MRYSGALRVDRHIHHFDDDHAEVMNGVLVSGSTELLTPLDYFSNPAQM
ncbi:hypothetical protein [Haladaptatus cibarius]|nr:hypothetical protein [Haladaptatus cibarius]